MDKTNIKIIVPLVDSIESAVICDLINQEKEKIFFVTIRLFNSSDELNRFKNLMNFLHENNKNNFFHYTNLENEYNSLISKYHSKEMGIFFGNPDENRIKIELKNSVLRYLSSILNAPVLDMSGKLSFLFENDNMYHNEPNEVQNLNKSNIYDIARKRLPKEFIMHYLAADLEKLKELSFEDITYNEIDYIVDELKNRDIALKKLANNEYSQEQCKIMNFILNKACN